jgi:hypothetical protein
VVKSAKPSRLYKPDARKLGHPMVGVNVLPHAEQVIRRASLEQWDYCLRRLFVLKGQSLKTAIGYAHPPPPFFLLTVMLTSSFRFLSLFP